MYVQHVIMDQDYVYGGKTKKETWERKKERQIILHFIIRIDFFLQTHHLTA